MQGASILTMAERVRRDNPAARCVLALDLGSRMGWAIQHLDGIVRCGTLILDARGGTGSRFLRLRRWLTEVKNAHGGIDALYYEQIAFSAGKNGRGQTQAAARLYGGWEATVTAWCEAHRIPYTGIANGTIKKHATGNGHAKKPEVVAAMQALGHNPRNDNEADALALLHLGLERMKEAA